MADTQVKNYLAEDIVVTYGGQQLTGWGDGATITIEPLGGEITTTVGIDNEMCRSMSTLTRFRITLPAAQYSKTNDKLSGAYNADRLSRGAGAMPFSIQDLNGSTKVVAAAAWVTNMPSAGFGREATENRDWIIETGPATGNIGGN